MRRQLFPSIFAALLLCAPLASPADEGYDPLRIISAQIARPSIYIVMDVSGSMTSNKFNSDVTVDSTGNWPTAAWSVVGSGTASSGKYKIWIATLTVSQKLPSRMCTVKNAMGNSVSIIEPWEPPDNSVYPASSTFPSLWTTGGTITGPTYTFTDSSTTKWAWAWKVTYTTYKSSPGTPFTCTQTIGTNASAPLYNGVYPDQLVPGDLLGQTKESVNWGLITYSGTNCTTPATVQVTIDSSDAGDDTAIQGKMKLTGSGGLDCGGYTPTKSALTYAKGRIQAIFDADPKYNCGRTYACVLMTDGLSNYCNTGGTDNNNWISPCGTCPGPTCCDVGSSGVNCPNTYTGFPAGSSEDMWNFSRVRNGVTYRLPVRTWVIGVSDRVGPCELNYTAYMGRTDASSPTGDAGFALNSNFPFPTAANAVKPLDPYLPQTTGDTSKYQLAHGNYAYFATSAGALKAAFEAIVGSLGPGDYTTSQPIVSSSTGNSGQVSLLASSEYPGWKGHLYADSLADGTPLWDAGERLSTRDAATRKIYTWNGSNALVEVTTANAATLNTLCGNCGITAAVVDYIRGVGRTWKLGAVLNSTPTIIAGPIQWKSDQVPSHAQFEADYGGRHPLIYAGASDGMLHAFDAVDGYEVFALLTPANLADQVTFYNNYMDSASRYPTGEPGLPPDHIWGVANSPRVQDVYFPSPTNGYKTLLFITQGPSSKTVAAIDVTHPYPGRTGVTRPDGAVRDYEADSNYSALNPVEVEWSKSSTDYPDLQYTWSIPAVASTYISTSAPNFEANIGSGWNPSSTKASQVAPKLRALNATNGNSNALATLSNLPSANILVGNQAFADTVMWKYDARVFKEGDAQNFSIQADLNGQIWFLARPSGSSATKIFDATTYAGQGQPIYYSPAVAGFKSKMCLAFASGSYFEKSSLVTGAAAAFRPRLYLIGKDQDLSGATSGQVRSWQITTLDNTVGSTLSNRATVVASPLLLVPNSDTGLAIALYAIYDPDSGDCAGTSYVVKIEFDPTDLASAATTVNLIGSGAISGFAVAGNVIVVAKSGVGSGSRATAPVVPNVSVGGSENGMRPVWWRELQ